MTFQELRSIEKLNYWELPPDPRSEAELMDDVEKYLLSARLLDHFRIEREVSPAVFDADDIMRRCGERCQNGRHHENGDVFDVNHYGKPASFVISDRAGNIRMLIMIGKELSFKHWLVKWAELWCREYRVPFLRLHVGKPNTEHYIIRRVYEEMGLARETYPFTPEKDSREPRRGLLHRISESLFGS